MLSDRNFLACLVLLLALAIIYGGLSIESGLIKGASNWTVIVKPDSIGWINDKGE